MNGRVPAGLLLGLALCAGAGAEPVFLFDTATRFVAGSADSLLVEALLSVDRGALAWVDADGGRAAGYRARFSVGRGETVLADTVWERHDWLDPQEELRPGQKIPDLVALRLPAGAWRTVLRVQDLGDGQTREKSSRLDLKPVDGPTLGQPRLSTGPPVPASQGPFRVGDWRLVPYADALFGAGVPVLQGWTALRAPDDLPECELAVRVLGEMQNRLLGQPPQPLDSVRLAGSDPPLLAFEVDVSKLASGPYFLELELRESATSRMLGSVRRGFWMENPGVEAADRELLSDEYDSYGAEELASLWDASQAVASWAEREAWERLDLDGRRAFLREFWLKRDPDRGTQVNEAKARLLALVEEAKRRFSEPGRAGHLTDRGRILLSYGRPESVETDFASLNSRFDFDLSRWQSGSNGYGAYEDTGSGHRDFELWVYDRLDGGALFVFVDVQGFGVYELVHSTKSGEYFDPNWGRKLFP